MVVLHGRRRKLRASAIANRPIGRDLQKPALRLLANARQPRFP
jgi:hypothetical protein